MGIAEFTVLIGDRSLVGDAHRVGQDAAALEGDALGGEGILVGILNVQL